MEANRSMTARRKNGGQCETRRKISQNLIRLATLWLLLNALIMPVTPVVAQTEIDIQDQPDAQDQSGVQVDPEARSHRMYVPMVVTEGPGGSGDEAADCALNDEEEKVANLLLNSPDQRRANPVCDPILAQVARARARDMALRGYFSHTNPDGDGPNLLVREAGFPLPDWYSGEQDANNIESIGGGYTSAAAVWQAWLDASSHRVHLLGERDFYADQNSFGIGYYFSSDSPMRHYWVFLSAPTAP